MSDEITEEVPVIEVDVPAAEQLDPDAVVIEDPDEFGDEEDTQDAPTD